MSTTATKIEFVVYGLAQTAGSKRAFPFKKGNGKLGVAVSDDNPKSRDWKNAVASTARNYYDGELLNGPIRLQLAFTLPRPKGHFGSGRNSGVIKPTSPAHPTTKPDVLKLARAVEDALTGVVWRDDSQIVSEILLKQYGEPARVDVVIEPLGALQLTVAKQPKLGDAFELIARLRSAGLSAWDSIPDPESYIKEMRGAHE